MRESSASSVLIWESGDNVAFDDLVMFLKVTGKFDELARHVIGRMAAAGPSLHADPAGDIGPAGLTSQALLDSTRAQWGWQSPEEAHVTMRDLGLGLDDIADSLDAEVSLRQLTAAGATSGSAEFLTALRVELWLNDLSLKRETLRLGALQYFAATGQADGTAHGSGTARCAPVSGARARVFFG